MASHLQPAPRELSGEEQEERARDCFALDQAIKAGLRSGREALWETARALTEFDDQAAWGPLGYDRLADWLADPEVSMTRSTYYRLTSVWREIGIIRGVDMVLLGGLDLSKVVTVLPAVKSGRVKWQDALDDVRVLGARDLREMYLARAEIGPGAADDVEQDASIVEVLEAPEVAAEEPLASPLSIVDAEVVNEQTGITLREACQQADQAIEIGAAFQIREALLVLLAMVRPEEEGR